MPKRSANMPQSMGSIQEKVDPPEDAGTISVAEAAEIRERKRLIEGVQKQIAEKQSELNDLGKVQQLLRVENTLYLEQICRARGLDLRDGYNVETETGRIWRTARGPKQVEQIEAATAPVEAGTAASNGKEK